MTEASSGHTVHIHYTGRFANGDVFDTSADREPLAFELGAGQVIPGMDQAVAGMAVGDKQTVTIDPAEGYGDRDERLVQQVPNEALAGQVEPTVGMQLQSEGPDGQATPVVIVEVAEETFTVDANHPLAGQVLEFDIELVSIG